MHIQHFHPTTLVFGGFTVLHIKHLHKCTIVRDFSLGYEQKKIFTHNVIKGLFFFSCINALHIIYHTLENIHFFFITVHISHLRSLTLALLSSLYLG